MLRPAAGKIPTKSHALIKGETHAFPFRLTLSRLEKNILTLIYKAYAHTPLAIIARHVKRHVSRAGIRAARTRPPDIPAGPDADTGPRLN